MKSKNLIKSLQEIDPSGEIEVCIGNGDIEEIFVSESDYDGTLQTIEFDEDGLPIKGRYHAFEEKIVLKPIFISDAIWRAAEQGVSFNIDYSDLSYSKRKNFQEVNEETKRQMFHMLESVEFQLFNKWVLSKTQDVYPEVTLNSIKFYTESFFRENLSRLCSFPENSNIPVEIQGSKVYKSYAERRYEQWDEEIVITFDGYDFALKRVSGLAIPCQTAELFDKDKALNQEIKKSLEKKEKGFLAKLKRFFKFKKEM